jgi:hypothetical protein
VTCITAPDGSYGYGKHVSDIVTPAELREIAPELHALAAVEPIAHVREALNRLASRYAALSDGAETATPRTPGLL